MRIVHVVPTVDRGSLGQIAVNLAKQQRRLGCEAKVWCTDIEQGVRNALAESGLREGEIVAYEAKGFPQIRYSPSMERAVNLNAGTPIDIVHQHGVWTALSRVTNKWRAIHRRPTVIAPHGSLAPIARNRSRWKKKIALMAYESENLGHASCLHATGWLELESLRAYGLRNPVALIPTGVSEEWLQSTGDSARFREGFDLPEERPIMLYLSRVTPIKGLPMLLKALANIRARLGDWLLVIAGPDEFNHTRTISDLVRQLSLERWVRLVGPVYDQQKRDAFAAASFFVLPSYSESSALVVTEALGAGLPVLTTRGTPWSELEVHNCGWWVETTVDGLANALTGITGLSQALLFEMGCRGREFVLKNSTWSQAAQKTRLLYSWLLGDAARPDFVELCGT
jgi:glycosyltransferase involved in cell wall biosynthesis